MSNKRILVEPAKSGKGKCHACKESIGQGELRVHVVDDREFREYIDRNGGPSVFHGEGMSRGYIEASEGVISVIKYYVHLSCYEPIHSHPWTKEWFKMEKFKEKHKTEFGEFLGRKSGTLAPNSIRDLIREQIAGLKANKSKSKSKGIQKAKTGKKGVKGKKGKTGKTQ